MAERVLVEFKHSSGMYNPGDVAAFVPEIANRLIEEGYAVEHKAKEKQARKTIKPEVDKQLTARKPTKNYVTK